MSAAKHTKDLPLMRISMRRARARARFARPEWRLRNLPRLLHDRGRGFSLIELLVAIALVAILSVSLFGTLRIAFKARESAEAAVEPARTAELAMDIIKTDLEAAMPPGKADTSLSAGFIGQDSADDRGRDGDDVLFYAIVPGPRHDIGDADMRRVEFAVVTEQGTGDHVLVRRVTSNLLSAVETDPDVEVVCRGVGAFNLRYFDGTDWLDTWDSTDTTATAAGLLPLAIEVMLVLDRTRPDGLAETIPFSRVVQLPCAQPGASTTTDDLGGTP